MAKEIIKKAGVSGNSVAGKSFQIFTVSEELLAKVVEAVQAGEKEARSSGNIQSFEVFCHGFRTNISLGRIMVVPAKVCNDRQNFPTALLHGALVRVFGTGGEEVADLVEKKIGDSEFDEYSQADFDTIKEELFTDVKTGEEASLIVFAPNWMNSREYICFHFNDNEEQLKNDLRHQVFSAYYNPSVSSAFNALMTNVDTTKVDVTDVTPKLSYPFLTENPLKQFPQLEKQGSYKKATILLNKKTAEGITKQTLDPQELDVFDSLNQALENSLLPDADGAQGEGGFKAPEAHPGVPREASDKQAEEHEVDLGSKGKFDVEKGGLHKALGIPEDQTIPMSKLHSVMNGDYPEHVKNMARSAIGLKSMHHGAEKIAHIDAKGICPGCKKAGNECSCQGCTCKKAAEEQKNNQEANARVNEYLRDMAARGFTPEPATVERLKKGTLKKVAYVSHCPGHENSKGEAAPWCIRQHNTDKILESFKSKSEAEAGLRNMESHKGSVEVAPHETPFTNVGPGSAAHAEQEASAPAMKESVGEDDPEHRVIDGDPIGIAIDETGVPRSKAEEKKAGKKAAPANNPNTNRRDFAHPETQRVDPNRLSSAYSAAYNGGFVDKHAMPPKEVRSYLNDKMGNNSEYAPDAAADHAKVIEAGAYGEDPLNRRSNEKWGSASIPVKFKRSAGVRDSLNDFEKGYIEAALWSTNDESTPSGGEPMDKNYDIEDISDEGMQQIRKDCAEFQQKAAPLLEEAYQRPGYGRPGEWSSEAMAGHDFWLTRCGHGVGFWDRDALEEGGLGDKLSEIARGFGNTDLYIGDDQRVHVASAKSKTFSPAYVASKLAKIVDSDGGYEAISSKAKKARAKKESLLDKFRPKTAVELDIDSIWDAITEDMGPAPLVDVDSDPSNPAPSNTEGESQSTPSDAKEEPRSGARPNKRDVEDLPEAFRSPEPEDEKSLSDSEADSQEDSTPHADSDTKESSWNVDSKYADFVEDVAGEIENEEEPARRLSCNQCQMMAINGHAVHEEGCPNDGARWDSESGMWIPQRECFECGMEVDEDDPCCSAPVMDEAEEARFGSAKQADTADNEYDIDAAADPTSKETGPSDTVECHQDYDAEQSEGTVRPKPGAGADIKQAGGVKRLYEDEMIKREEMLNSIQNGDRVTILVPAGMGRGGQEWAERSGRAVMRSAEGGWVLNMGGQHGTPGLVNERNIVKVHKRKQADGDTVKCPKCGSANVSYDANPNTWACHSCDAKFGDGRKQADTADNPYNMTNDGKGAPENKKVVNVKDTTGPTPDNTKKAQNQNKGVKQMIGEKHDHGVEGDVAQAKSETTSPDVVDADISQPTVSVLDAGKRKNSGGKETKDKQDYCECGRLRSECTGGYAKNRNTLHSDKTGADKTAGTWMNEYEVQEAMQLLGSDPVVGKYVRFLSEFMDQVNSHSDGWAYWKLPAHAASQLMTLIKAALDKRRGYNRSNEPQVEVTEQLLRKAMGPIKSFMTRRGLAAGMEMPKIAADISGDMSEAKAELDYNKAEIADDPQATQTVSVEDAGGRKNSADISGDIAEADAAIDYDKSVIADDPQAEGTVNPEHFADDKTACGDDQPESIEFDFGAGDLADIVLVENEEVE